MSATELGDLESLLERVLPDPMGFAERVVGQLLDRLATDAPAVAPIVVAGFEAQAHEALVDRNMLVAAAVGACDCWAQDPDCPVCAGQGMAGWMRPDPQLYEEFVGPAVTRMTNQAATTGEHRQSGTSGEGSTT